MSHHEDNKSILCITLSRILGLACFIFLIFFLNYIAPYVNNSLYNDALAFLNSNIIILITISVIYAVGDIFGALGFPLNLPAPIFNAVASVFLAQFMLELLSFVGDVVHEPVLSTFTKYKELIFIVVFLLVLAGGYIIIFARLFIKDKKR